MKTFEIKKASFATNKLASSMGFLLLSNQLVFAATATVDVVITAGGTETALVAQPYSAPLNGIAKFDTGCHALCGGPETRSTDETHGIPSQYSHCTIDTSRGNKLPGLSVYVSSNSPGSSSNPKSESYSLDFATRTMRVQASVASVRKQGAWYTGTYEIHVKCPQTAAWTNSENRTVTVDSKNGYANVGTYTGPIGSINGLPGTAVVDNNLFKVDVKSTNPTDATVTAGMFLTSPANGQKGPNLFALYEPTNIAAPAVKLLSSQAITNQGGGSAIADLNNNGIEDIMFVSYQDVVNYDGRNEFTYQIGWDIDAEGNPKSLSPLKRVDGTGWEGNGATVALFKPATAGALAKAIFVNHDQGSQPVNDLRMRYGTIDGNGNFIYSNHIIIPSFGASVYGIGAELYDIDNNGLPEIIISGNSTANSSHAYKIGWNLQDNGTIGQWTTHTGNSFSNTGVAMSMANLDRNPRPEMVMVYRDTSDGRLYHITGWNLDQYGEPLHWGHPSPLPFSLPTAAHHIDLSIMDMDVFGQALQRGAGHREKTMVITGLENNPAGVDNFYYSFIRHSNAKDGVANGSLSTNQKWHRWGPTSYDATQGAICSTGANSLPQTWDAGTYSTEPIAIESGKPYAITFDAWSPAGEASKTIGVKLGSATTNTTIYRQNMSHAVKPGWNRYQLTYNASVTDPNARLEFFFGGSTAPSKVCIDNLRVSTWLNTTNDFASFPLNNAANLIKNGTFNYGSMAGWINKSAAYGASQASSKIKNGELCHFTPGGTARDHESFGQNNIALQNGARYRLSYDIRGHYSSPINTAKPKVNVKLGGDGGSTVGFADYITEYDLEVPKEKTTRHIEFIMADITDPIAGLAIFTGNSSPSEICIDNVSLTKL